MRVTWIHFVAAAALLPGCFGNSSSGQGGKVQFSYSACLFDCGLDRHAMAAGGAEATIVANADPGVPQFATVSSSHPEVATFVRGDQSNEVVATSAQQGTTDLILIDALGKEIDRAQVTVRNTTKLAVDTGWGASSGPTILRQSQQVLHVTTMSGTETLVGTGAVTFTPTGPIQHVPVLTFGDEYGFTGDVGSADIRADCVDAHVDVPITIVPETAITSADVSSPQITIARNAKVNVDITPKAGSEPVFGAFCIWSVQPTAGLQAPELTKGGTINLTATQSWQFTGTTAGSYTATCALPGGMNETVAVTVQ